MKLDFMELNEDTVYKHFPIYLYSNFICNKDLDIYVH